MISKRDLKRMISESSMKTIELLENILDEKGDNDFGNLLIVVKGNLLEIEKVNRSGASDTEDYNRDMNRINLNILKMIDDLPAHYFEQAVAKESKTEYNRNEFEVSALIRELGELEIREAECTNPFARGYINAKRHLIAVQVSRMIEQTNTAVSSLEYSVIAYSFFRSVDIVKAEQLYIKAIGNIDEYTDSAQSKINAIRSYANFLYNLNRYGDGAKQYESAILEGDIETNNVINGYTYQAKFANECDIPDYEKAVISYKMAKGYYLKIKNNLVRNNNLNGLETVWNDKKVPSSFTKP